MRLNPIAILIAAFLPCHLNAATPNMKEGLWEITVKTEMQGMPGGMPPQTIQQCVTQKDLADPAKTTPGAQADRRCQITDYKLQGNTASWKLTCAGGQDMSGTGTATYGGTAYTGSQNLSIQHEGQTVNMTVNFAGRHLGDCGK